MHTEYNHYYYKGRGSEPERKIESVHDRCEMHTE